MKEKILKFNKLIISIILIGVFVFGYFLFFAEKQVAQADWWNDSWTYRKSVQVTNNTSEETNVYISLTIDTSATSTIQSDCGDLRFTRANGEALDYYLVSGCESSNTVVHVNFQTFASGEQAIYYYYGNELAENGFKVSDFSTEASDYTIGTVGTEETGPGPVGFWSFNEGYGSTAHDSSFGNNDGTITGAEWKNEEECVSGKCLYFDGVDETRIETNATADNSLDNMTEFTACTWFKAASTTNEDGDINVSLIEKSWSLKIIQSSGKLRFWIATDSSYPSAYSPEAITLNKWYYVCGVYYGVGTYPKMFIDGVDKGVDGSYGGGTQLDDSGDTLKIGGTQWTNNFNGYIDEVKIYPYARTADEIKQDYNAGLAGVSTPKGTSVSFGSKSDSWMSDGLVGYWKFDEIATTSGAIDSSGNRNDGTYEGTASTTGGKFGNGGVFDGDISDVNIDNFSSNSFSHSFCFWENRINADYIFDGVYPNESNRLQITLGTNCSSNLCVYVGSAQRDLDTIIPTGEWHYVCVVLNNNNKTITGYLDGIESGTDVYSGITLTSNFYANIGAHYSGTSYNYAGKVDEMRIYNRALSKDEVRHLYEWAPGPVLHLKMDEKEGTTAYDTSGYGNNGTLTNGPTWDRGRYGSALSFDHNDDYVSVGDIGTNITSFSFWFKPNTIINKDTGTRFSLQSNTNMGVLMGDSTGYLSNEIIEIRSSGGDNTGWCSATDSISKDWHFLAAFYNGSRYEIYLDGQRKDNCIHGSPTELAGTNVWIGKHTSFLAWDGLIDDVKIYNYARTQKQILEDMYNGNPMRGAVLDINFDEAYGATVHDNSGNGNNGTASSSTSGTNTTVSEMWDLGGKFGGAMDFDGTDDYVDFGDIGLDINSISFWIKPDSLTESIIDLDGGTHTISISSGLISVSGFSSPSIYVDGENKSLLPDTAWHHVLITTDTAIDANNFDIGRISSNYFSGLLDELKLWSYALSEDEVRREYNHGASVSFGEVKTANNNGTTTTGKSADYCVPGDTAQCDPPVLELKMDEKQGTTAYDTSGNGNDVTLMNGPNWSRGKKGSGLSFDGNDDYLESISSIDANFKTFSAWVYMNGYGENDAGIIFHQYFYYEFGVSSSSKLTLKTLTFSGSQDKWSSPENSLSLNKWVYVTVVNPSDPNFYINGVEVVTTQDDVHSGMPMAGGTGEWIIGDNIDHLASFDGIIDEVKVYNYNRTPAQIAWEYNKGKPVAHWKFDECSGSTIHDNSGNGNHGTLNLGSSGTTVTGTCASSSDSFWYNGRNGADEYSGSFDGADDWVDIGDTTYDINSISFWMKADSLTESIIDLDGGTHTISISSGLVSANGFSSPTIYIDAINKSSISDTAWHHIFVKTDTAIDVNNFDIGRISTNYFDGQIDDVKIWNYALTDSQIIQAYNGGAVKFGG